jgi:hypothetical protein
MQACTKEEQKESHHGLLWGVLLWLTWLISDVSTCTINTTLATLLTRWAGPFLITLSGKISFACYFHFLVQKGSGEGKAG